MVLVDIKFAENPARFFILPQISQKIIERMKKKTDNRQKAFLEKQKVPVNFSDIVEQAEFNCLPLVDIVPPVDQFFDFMGDRYRMFCLKSGSFLKRARSSIFK